LPIKGFTPRNLHLISSGPGRKRSAYPCPAWLPAEAKSEWSRAVQDPSSRGLMFDGALASLEHYVLCIAQIRQCQKILAEQPIAGIEGIHPAYTAQQKAIQSARLLAVELGLSIVSRTRSFQGKSADERDWGELEVG
jgi:P27 family predicted phage terminase small subunit